MPPSKVVVMRHAEKPDDPYDPELTGAGKARAAKLATWLPTAVGTPGFIFATANSKHSRRPLQTVEPLARFLGLAVDQDYADQDYGALARALLADGAFDAATVLVCWHHGNIPNLMHALGAADGSYPDPWDRNVFDLVFSVDYAADARPDVAAIVEPF